MDSRLLSVGFHLEFPHSFSEGLADLAKHYFVEMEDSLHPSLVLSELGNRIQEELLWNPFNGSSIQPHIY